MKNHTKVYFKAFGYDESDFIPSEISGQKAVDIHHILSRKKGGKDVIENLMALTREEHLKYGDKVQYVDFLKNVHSQFMQKNGVKPSNDKVRESVKLVDEYLKWVKGNDLTDERY